MGDISLPNAKAPISSIAEGIFIAFDINLSARNEAVMKQLEG